MLPMHRSVAALSPSLMPCSPAQCNIVPEVAHISTGGWVNPANWLFNIVYNRVNDMGLDELEKAYFTRNARPLYGENHTSTRSKKRGEPETLDDDAGFYVSSSKKSTENHKIQERDRRDRHRVLQKETDDCTPTFLFDLAEKQLSKVKDFIKDLSKEDIDSDNSYAQQNDKIPSSSTAAKKTGKDDQLLSAALFAPLSAYVILRERQARINAEENVQQLEKELKGVHDARMVAEDRAARLEVDNKYYAEEVTYLRQQHDHQLSETAVQPCFAQPRLPAPTASYKRSAPSIDCSRANYSSAKRQRPTVDQMNQPSHGERRCHLPPSPSPSCDECSPSFCSC